MIGQQGATWIPVPAFTRGWVRGKPHYIIIHGTASGTGYPAQQTATDFPKNGNSTHYVIGYDGALVQCVDEANAAWGNGVISGPAGVARQGDPSGPHDAFWDSIGANPNDDTLSIETSRSSDNTSEWSPIQTLQIYSLVAGMCQRWGIPSHMADATGGITGHFSIDPVHRSFCPGPVNWEGLIAGAGGSGLFGPGVGFPTSYGPQTGYATAPLAVTRSNNMYLETSQNVHETLAHAPGFYGVCLALDEAEQFPGIYNAFTGDTNPSDAASNGWMSVAGTVNGNALAFAIRAGLVVTGAFLLISLIHNGISPMRALISNQIAQGGSA